jgi:hypothetical protein
MPEAMFSTPSFIKYSGPHTRERAWSYTNSAVIQLEEEGFPVRYLSGSMDPAVVHIIDPRSNIPRMCFTVIETELGILTVKFGAIWLESLVNYRDPDEFVTDSKEHVRKTVNRIVSEVKERYQAELDYLAKEEETKNRRDAMATTLLALGEEFPEYKTLLNVGTKGTLTFNFESETEDAPEIRAILEALSSAKVEIPPCE